MPTDASAGQVNDQNSKDEILTDGQPSKKAGPAPASDAAVNKTLLQQIVDAAETGRTPIEKQTTLTILTRFLTKRRDLEDRIKASPDAAAKLSLETEIHSEINNIDAFVNTNLDRVMHHPKFQRVEARWRGLRRLVSESEDDPRIIRFRLINASQAELSADLADPKIENSDMFKKIHERGFGRYGAHPYGVLLLDFAFTPSQGDMALLTKLGQLGAVSHCPVVAAAAPRMFGLQDFSGLEQARRLKFIMNGPEYLHWHQFREHPNSRYVGLLLPRILLRSPHPQGGGETDIDDNKSAPEFVYREGVAGPSDRDFLWGSPIWAYGECLTGSFFRYGFLSAVQGAEGGGQVELPCHVFGGHVQRKAGPCDIAVPDSWEQDLSEAGFMALVSEEAKARAVFFSGQSCQKPQQYYESEATASAELSAELPNVFAIARFAHYIKVMLRKKIGQFMSAEDCRLFFETWIANYVLSRADAHPVDKAQRPLRDARIEVQDVPGKPGQYIVTAWVTPHYRLKKVGVSLRLVSALPKDIKKQS